MNNQIAIIDLGTNTCNLLVAEYQDEKYKIMFQGKEVVKLGKNGIDKNLLAEDGLERAILAIQKHKIKIKEFKNPEIRVFGTSAIRDAKNRNWFVEEIECKTGLPIDVISGEKEADLIYKGVKLAFGTVEDDTLILDIGGGSNEFILTKANSPCWKQSFPLGMARIIDAFPPSDPIRADETEAIRAHFITKLDELWSKTSGLKIPYLIGCSGAFDTLADIIDQTEPGMKQRISQELSLSDLYRVFQILIHSTTSERAKMVGMELIRIEMIVPAVLFIQTVLEKLKIQKIYQTDFALREGVLYDRIFN